MSNSFIYLCMATIKLAHIVSDVKGSIGGSIFGNTRNQMYIRNKTSQINKVTPAQGRQRQFITSLTQSWRNLTENQRIQWNRFSNQHRTVNRVGNTVHGTGFNWYIKLNSNLNIAGQSLITEPVESPVFPIFGEFALFAVNAAQIALLGYITPLPAGYTYVTYASTSLPTSTIAKPNMMKFIARESFVGSTFKNVTVQYKNIFGSIGPTGMMINIYTKIVHNASGFAVQTPIGNVLLIT